MYMNVALDDIIKSGVVSETELQWAANCRIPYANSAALWARKWAVDSAIMYAIESGVLKPIEREPIVSRTVNVIGDYINGAGSELRSQADGKMYDSKSAYRKSLKAHGMVEMGTDAPTQGRKELKGDYDCSKELREAIQQHLG